MTRWALAFGALGLAGMMALALGRPGETLLGSYGTPLEGRTRNQGHNAELAARRLRGAVVGPGEVFSFNRRVGILSMDRGFRKAPVSYNGQLIESWGGGVCQTSTTLYNAALLAGLEIVERSRHRFAPSYIPVGLDAAVAYDGIDLKLRNPHPFPVRIDAGIESGRLVVRIFGAGPLRDRPRLERQILSAARPREFHVGDPIGPRRVRNSGKPGAEVAVYRVWKGERELISVDTYPVLHRIVEGD